MDLILANAGVLQNLLNRLHSPPEQVHIKLLKLGAGQGLAEIVSPFEGFNFKFGGCLA
jgi:hypothetical protein